MTFSYDILDAADYELLKEIADEIHAALRHRAATVVLIGQRLTLVRDRLQPVIFTKWLADEFAWSKRTAENYIRVAARFPTAKHLEKVHLAALYFLARESTHPAVAEYYLQLASQGEVITLPFAIEVARQNAAEINAEINAETAANSPHQSAAQNPQQSAPQQPTLQRDTPQQSTPQRSTAPTESHPAASPADYASSPTSSPAPNPAPAFRRHSYVRRLRLQCDLTRLADHLDALANELDPPSADSPEVGAQKIVSQQVFHNPHARQTASATTLTAENTLRDQCTPFQRTPQSTICPDANYLGAQKIVSQPASHPPARHTESAPPLVAPPLCASLQRTRQSTISSDTDYPGAHKTVSNPPPETSPPPRFIDSRRNPLVHNRFDMSDFYSAVVAQLPLQPRRENLPRPPAQTTSHPPPQTSNRQSPKPRSRGKKPSRRDRYPPPARPPPHHDLIE